MLKKKHRDNDEQNDTAQAVEEDSILSEPEEDPRIAELELTAKRALADYQNLQRRVKEDRQTIVKYATESLLNQLLPIVDTLGQAVDMAPEEEQKSSWFSAVSMMVNQLKEVLKREGIEEIDPEGQKFNPEEQEVVDVINGDDEKVIKVLQKGYKLHGKVVRVARVQVGKKGA